MSVIAIAGYSGSGKDLVGRMIQLFMCSEMIDNHEVLEEILDNYDQHQWWIEEQSGWEIKKFAGKLKQIASILTGYSIESFESQELKKNSLGPQWNYMEQEFVEQGVYHAREKEMTIRDLLQKVGTDAMRNNVHPDVWVNALFADYTGVHTDYVPGGFEYPNWIITDCRFPNEAEAVKKRKGIIIRVNRPGVEPINAHPSETALDGWKYDDVINNTGSVKDLLKEVKRVLTEQTILV